MWIAMFKQFSSEAVACWIHVQKLYFKVPLVHRRKSDNMRSRMKILNTVIP